MKTVKYIVFFIAVTFILSGCIHQAETGKDVFLITSAGFENNLGADAYKDMLKDEKISTDKRLNGILQKVGRRIAASTGKTSFKWEFKLIESEQMNAWCLPGGKVAVYTGILPIMKTEAGMATVIGHEVAHAILRHSGQRMSQQLVVNMGLAVADISLKNKKHKNTIIGLLGAGATVGILLPYGREHERESDKLGLKYMAAAGYDPSEAVRLWERFSKATGSGPPQFLSTHPASSERIANMKRDLPEAMRIYQNSKVKYGIGENF